MRYTLVCLSHRASTDMFAKTMASFRTHVRPLPARVMLVHDGPLTQVQSQDYFNIHPGVDIYATERTNGFCDATAQAWALGVLSEQDFVFHLEHDFIFNKTVDLEMISHVLVATPQLAQMSLMRQPVNPKEIREGSVVASFPEGSFERCDYIEYGFGSENHHPYLTHRSYFTTNPSLMRRAFMEANPWPLYARQCEGRFTHDLVSRGFSFGVWGDGKPWVTHIGERDGFGY